MADAKKAKKKTVAKAKTKGTARSDPQTRQAKSAD